MSDRVVLVPYGAPVPPWLTVLGRGPIGTWGMVEGSHWLGAGGKDDPIELLYLSPAEYHHAVRRLPSEEIEPVVQRRRLTFAHQVSSLALGLVERQLRDCFALFRESERDACAELVQSLAAWTAVPRFSSIASTALLNLVLEGDARIIAELDSPSLQAAGDLDPTGEERASRRRFATETGALLARRGDPDAGRALPYFDVERVYLIQPVPEDLESTAHAFHDPVARVGDGLLLPLAERNAVMLTAEGYQMSAAFPTRGQFVGLASTLTAAQLAIELEERQRAAGFVPYLAALRVQQTTLRTAAQRLAREDDELARVLDDHLTTR